MILKYALGHYPSHSLTSPIHSHPPQQQSTTLHQHIPTIQEIKKQWNQYGDGIKGTDMASLTFYFSLLSLMDLPSAQNILEVGCGTGKLIPLALMLKQANATYLATDLTANMISNAKANLKQYFDCYQSKLTFQEWCTKQKLNFKLADGEQIIEPKLKFDRIICNCVLMITQNPHKMLHSLFDQAAPGCLLGISIWGDKNKNPMLKFITELIKQESKGNSVRDQFHLYKKVGKIAEEIGWKLLLQWEQNALVPIVKLDEKKNDLDKTLDFFMNYLPENKRLSARKMVLDKAKQLLESKEGLNFSTELYIFRKPY